MRTKSKMSPRQAAPGVTRGPALRVAELCVLAGIYGALLAPLVYTQSTIYPFVYPKALLFQAVVEKGVVTVCAHSKAPQLLQSSFS